jgi:ATP-dependent DNA ligase
MNNLPTLYKRTKIGAIQYWSIGTKPMNNGTIIAKESGQLGTDKPLFHAESITVGKQKRTPEQQAEFMALSDWRKKKDEGYKSLEDLGIGFIHEGSDAGHFTLHGTIVKPGKQLGILLDEVMPKFNSDSSGQTKPMLATDWKKIKKIEYPVLLQPKLDGVRCLMVVDFTKGEFITFLSRSGKKYPSLEHIAASVMRSNKLNTRQFILDGEVYSDELSFQDITSAVKAYKENSLKLRFRAYDIVNDSPQMVRSEQLVDLVVAIDSPFIQLVTTITVENAGDVKFHHDDWVGRGYEGAMIRLLHGKYAQGQRSRELLKVKEFDETEFAFKNFEFGQRGVEDLIAVLWDATGEKEFRAKMIGTREHKEELYKLNDESEGKSMTIKHFGYTEDKLPRFPIGKAFRNYE